MSLAFDAGVGDEPTLVACLVARRSRFAVAEPFFEPGLPIALGRAGSVDAAAGDLVLVRPGPGGSRGRIVERLGRPDDIRAVLHALAAEAGAARPFPPEVQSAADALPADAGPPAEGRRDLRGLLAFTVDPGTAKDHDDALSVERVGDGLRVLVHIADVAAVVEADGPIDREARRRSLSTYLPGRVEPMLPPKLSAGLCSLAPERDRDVVTVAIPFDAALRPGRPSVFRAQIRSARRFAYDEVEELLAGRGGWPEPLRDAVLDADRIAAALRVARRQRGASFLDRPETEIALADGRVADARLVAEPRAHALVEELMIAANEAVASLLTRARRPALFRAHEPPDPESVERLYAALADLEVPTPPLADPLGPSEAARAVAAAARTVAAHARTQGRGDDAWSTLVLRSMQRARYDAGVRVHAGLASPAYAHFTSPIRRYPDLVVHRALLAELGLEPDPAPADLDALAVHCSDAERTAAALERRGDAICLATLLAERLGPARDEVFAGEIVGLIGAGLFVRFGGPFEGFLPSPRLWRDRYEVSELGTALVGRSSGHRYRLGDALRVGVERIEPERGRVTLRLVDGRGAE